MTDLRGEEISRILVGDSRAIREVRREIIRFGPTKLPILIQGPTGSGKELAARAIHGVSRRDGALVAFNVCALGDGMFEDALFGHVRGAFTGAARDAPGYLAEANGGTVFLDEISGLSMASQAKLLRALETGVFRPIGASRDRMSDFRLLSASNENLARRTRERTFRSDLWHRIGGHVLILPSLNDRREDVPVLVRHFIGGSCPDQRMSVAALDRLQEHSWEGSVRELRHVIERLLIVADGDEICVKDVEAALSRVAQVESDMHVALRARLVDALEQSRGDTALAAERLGIHRATMYRWIRRVGVEADCPSHLGKDHELMSPSSRLRIL